jgi:hypothetical protein
MEQQEDRELLLLDIYPYNKMESCWAKIENGVVTFVECVTDEFVAANPERYSGIWKKVGTETQPFVGKEFILLENKDKIIEPQPFKSWILDEKDQWQAPKEMPKEGNWSWDEEKQDWVESPPK